MHLNILLYAELLTDTLTGRTIDRAAALDTLKAEADQRFSRRFDEKVAAAGGDVAEGAHAVDLLRGADALVRRASFTDADAALRAALGLWSEPPNEGSELRMTIAPAEDAARPSAHASSFALARALCMVARPGQILVAESLRHDLGAMIEEPLRLRSFSGVRLLDLSPERTILLIEDGKQGAGIRPKGLDGTAHNLPVVDAPFVGRVQARRDLRLLLLAHSLVTVVGGGGVGKTRLALQLAAETAHDYPDGVWLAELASVSNPALIGETLAACLGLEETSAQPSVDTVADWLAERQALLVLDNCEHLHAECRAACARLIDRCPGLRVLATSRRSLELPSEHVFELPPLGLSDEGESEAVRLFELRASHRVAQRNGRRRAEVSLDRELLTKLCRLLEGNPLAIELATARVPRWTVAEILDRVSARYDALGEDPDPPHPRHRSLWATFEWSFQLLSADARRLFRRLSVFQGGATAQFIVEVLSNELLPESQVEQALSELVASHLVDQDRSDAHSMRFRQLETLRSFASEKLEEAGETEEFRARHAAHYRQMLILRSPALNGPEQAAVQRVFRSEHGNIRVALDWHTEEGEVEHGLRIGVALRRFWIALGFLNEGRYYFQRLLDAADETVAPDARANATYCLATIALRQSDFDLATECLERSLAFAEAEADLALAGKIRNTLGSLAWRKADIVTAQAHFTRSLHLLQEMEHEVGITTALNSVAVTHLFTGEFDSATDYLQQSLELAREIGNERSAIDALNNLAIIHGVRGEYGRARSLLAEGMNALQHFHDARRMAMSMNNLAHIVYRQGRLEAARELCEGAIEMEEELGDQGGILFSRVTLGVVAIAADDLEEADRQFQQCVRISETYDEQSFGAEIQLGMGRVALRRGRLDEAEGLLGMAETAASSMPHQNVHAHTQHALARLAMARGDVEKARDRLAACLRLRRTIHNRRGIAEALESYAELSMGAGDTRWAVRLHAAAAGEREAIGTPLPPSEIRSVEEQLAELREQHGLMAFDVEWEAGSHIPIDEIVLQVLEQSPP